MPSWAEKTREADRACGWRENCPVFFRHWRDGDGPRKHGIFKLY